jgi:hypothetical protein
MKIICDLFCELPPVPVIAVVAMDEGNISPTLLALVLVVVVETMPINKFLELTFVPNIDPIVL